MKNDLNFFKAIPCGGERDKPVVSRLSMLLIGALVLPTVALAIGFGGLVLQTRWVEKQVQSTEAFVQDPLNTQQSANAESLREELSGLRGYQELLERSKQTLDSGPHFSYQLYQTVNQMLGEDTTVLEYQYTGTQLVLRCQSTGSTAPNRYAYNLHTTQQFSWVEYSGFTQGGGNAYTFTVICHMKGGKAGE